MKTDEKSTLGIIEDELEARGKGGWKDYVTYVVFAVLLIVLLLVLW